MVHLRITHRLPDLQYDYYFRDILGHWQLEKWLKKRIELIKKDDPKELTWDLTIHKTILEKVRKLQLPGQTILDTEYLVTIEQLKVENLDD